MEAREDKKKGGRPIGSATYDSVEMVDAALARQHKRLETLVEQRSQYHYKSQEYKNLNASVGETRSRISVLQDKRERMSRQ
jgi:hypothetical protein